jgi:type II secretory pathway pseudopilin PulG
MPTPSSRRGYTLFELIVILAILILLAVVLIPSIYTFRGDTRSRGALDSIRAELAIARARAKEEGRPYRVAISEDGRRLRRAPDTSDFPLVAALDQASGLAAAVEYPFEAVVVNVVAEQDGEPPVVDAGWVTIATVLPDGSCRELTTLLALRDIDSDLTLYARVRGITASVRVVPNPTTNTNIGGGAR